MLEMETFGRGFRRGRETRAERVLRPVDKISQSIHSQMAVVGVGKVRDLVLT